MLTIDRTLLVVIAAALIALVVVTVAPGPFSRCSTESLGGYINEDGGVFGGGPLIPARRVVCEPSWMP